MTTYNQTSYNNASDPTNTAIVSEKIVTSDSLLFGLTVTDVKFYIWNPSSHTGTVTCGLFATDGTLKHTFWTMDMSTLPTSNTGLKQGTMTPYTSLTVVGDCIGVKTSGASGIKFAIALNQDPFDGTDTMWAINGDNEPYGYTGDAGFSITVEEPAPSGGDNITIPQIPKSKFINPAFLVS